MLVNLNFYKTIKFLSGWADKPSLPKKFYRIINLYFFKELLKVLITKF